MHACLRVDEIVRLVASELVWYRGRGTSVALACSCKSLEDPVLDMLWEFQTRVRPLLRSLPGDVWNDDRRIVSLTTTLLPFLSLTNLVLKTFKRLPTTLEWARFRKYARRMRTLVEPAHPSVLPPEVFSILQLYATDKPLFPNLKILRLWELNAETIPFIPSFLSPRTTSIELRFLSNSPKAMVASLITAFPTLCPNLKTIILYLPSDPMIAAAVSGTVLATNRNALLFFRVDCLLTQEARKVICELPNLRQLSMVIGSGTPLPLLMLPSLTNLTVTCHGGSDWLEGFRGATLGKLASITVNFKSNSIGNFLEAFESVMLTASISGNLSTLSFNTSHLWRPNYRSLLPFTQLNNLTVSFSCERSCSSTIDDDTIIDIARAMPKLELLQLGGQHCRTPTGVTAKGLAALAYYCPNLDTLRIHFQVDSLDQPSTSIITSGDNHITSRADCALTVLSVGEIPVMEESNTLVVALTLLRIFPRLELIVYSDEEQWEEVAEAIEISKKLADASSKFSLTLP